MMILLGELNLGALVIIVLKFESIVEYFVFRRLSQQPKYKRLMNIRRKIASLSVILSKKLTFGILIACRKQL